MNKEYNEIRNARWARDDKRKEMAKRKKEAGAAITKMNKLHTQRKFTSSEGTE